MSKVSREVKLSKALRSEEFNLAIDSFAKEHKLDYIDAVVTYCERNKIEIETAASLIKNSGLLKANIQAEAESLNYLPKTGKLNF